MKERMHLMFSMLILMLLSGCGRVKDWGEKYFYQGESLCDLVDVPEHYVKEVIVHNQIRTQAKFVGLWTSADQVLHAYVDIHGRRYGLSEGEQHELLEKKRKEYNNQIIFYVLSLYNVPLGDAESAWGVYLCVADRIMRPKEIKKVELSPEYKAIFADTYTVFKDAYQISFDGYDNGMLLTESGACTMVLNFVTIEKEAQLCWNLKGPQITFENDIRRERPWHICAQDRV